MTMLKAILFDKDGTLFDFRFTWDGWAGRVVRDLSGGVEELAARIADAIHYDLGAGRFRMSSPLIAGTNREAAEIVAAALQDRDVDRVEARLAALALEAELRAAVPLAPLLSGLKARGLRLGLMTNDAEAVAHAHVGQAGVAEQFDFIAGFDSGYGAKPDPGPLLAFAGAMDLPPGACAMVGDSAHDLHAARAAGMHRIAVLTGIAEREELSPIADVVLADIGELPGWLDARG